MLDTKCYNTSRSSCQWRVTARSQRQKVLHIDCSLRAEHACAVRTRPFVTLQLREVLVESPRTWATVLVIQAMKLGL